MAINNIYDLRIDSSNNNLLYTKSTLTTDFIISTDNLIEGSTNLFYMDSRVDARINLYNSTQGVVNTILGTTNQITASNSSGTVTLSLTPSVYITGSMFMGATTNQLVLGTTNTITISSTAPSASRVYTLPDFGANAIIPLSTAGNSLSFTTSANSTLALPTSGTLYGTATGSITSTQLATSLTDETGTGLVVFNNTPTFITPILGVATATSINKLTLTTPTTGATLTLADNSSLITSGAFSTTLTSTATTSVTLPTTGTLATLAGSESLTNKTLTSSTNILGGVTMTLGSDATGDTYYRGSGSTLTRLGVGSNGQVLTVSGGLPSWATSLKEDLANKATDFSILNNTLYPTTLATSNYVGQLLNGLNWKFSVTCATASTLTVSSFSSNFINLGPLASLIIDGYDIGLNTEGLAVRILIKNASVGGIYSGIYYVSQIGGVSTDWILTRTLDGDTVSELTGATVLVRNGTVEKNKVYTFSGDNYALAMGSITWTLALVNQANTYTNGSGLTLTGNVFSIASGAITNAMLAGSIDLTTKVTGILPSANGGTGVNNSSSTITLSGNLITSGAFSTTLTSTATTNVTLPTTGTLYSTATGSITSAQLATSLTDETGTGVAVFSTSPTLVTPNLGTPSTLVGTNITGTASGFTAGTVTTNANLTGHITSIGNATVLGSFTSAQLLGALTDETGTGVNVFATSPTLVTPVLGVATATSINKLTLTAPTTSATLTIVDGSSLITSGAFSTTLTSTGTTNVTLPTSGTLATLAGSESLTNKTLTSSTNILGGVTMTLGSDATGDTYYRGSNSLLTRLGVGSNGQVLTVSSGLPSWATPATVNDKYYNESTGVYKGGILTIGTPNTTFSISNGNGAITDNTTGTNSYTEVSWTGKTNITATYITSGLVSYVAIDINGNVIQQLAPFTQTQSRSLIFLGSLIHTNLAILDGVNNFQDVILSPANMVHDLSHGLGIFNVNGNLFSANGANLNLNKSVGTVYSVGSNWVNNPLDPSNVILSSLTALTFQYRFQNGANGATGTVINPDIYDVGGVSTAVPSGKYTIQRIFCFVSNSVVIQPGQAFYQTLAEAKSAIQTEIFTTETSISQNGLLRGFLIIKHGTTSLLNTSDCFFYEAQKFGGQQGIGGQSVSTLQNAYDNSITPEITTDATRGALSLKRGSVADTDLVLEILNNSGTVTSSISGNGNIIGLTYNKVTITTPITGATLTLANNSSLITSGAFSTTLTSTATTSVTLPTSGTLYGTSTGSITSAQLATSLTDETGSGLAVFNNTPTLITPILGVATATSINKVTITAPTTSATLTLVDGSSLITSGAFSTTLTSTATTNVTLPTSGTLYGTATASITSAQLAGSLTDETGTGVVVFSTSPTLVTPNLGTPSTLVGTNITGTASGFTAGTVTTNANLTGVVTSVGNATSIGTGAITDAMLSSSFIKLNGTTTTTAQIPFALGINSTTDSLINGLTVGKGSGNIATNTVLGNNSLILNATGVHNVAIGVESLKNNSSGGYNLAIGTSSLSFNTTGSSNIGIGFNSLGSNTTGSNNAAFGRNAGSGNTTGSFNLLLGDNSDVGFNNLTNAIAIGYNATVNASNTIQLGDNNITNVKTQGTLTLNAVTYPNTHGTVNQVLTTSGSGTLTWTTITAGSGTVTSVSVVSANGVSGTVATATTTPAITLTLGAITPSSVNKVTITAPTTSATLTLVDGSSLITSGAFSTTLTSTATTNVILPTTGTLSTLAGTETLTNKRITPRTGTTTSNATPSINTDIVDFYSITAQTVAITGFTMSGTPTNGQKLWISITGTAARAITWGASFEASTIALPTTTVTTARLDVGFIWNTATSKWRCVGTC